MDLWGRWRGWRVLPNRKEIWKPTHAHAHTRTHAQAKITNTSKTVAKGEYFPEEYSRNIFSEDKEKLSRLNNSACLLEGKRWGYAEVKRKSRHSLELWTSILCCLRGWGLEQTRLKLRALR